VCRAGLDLDDGRRGVPAQPLVGACPGVKRGIERRVGDVGAQARQTQLARPEQHLRRAQQPAAVIDDAYTFQRRAVLPAVLPDAQVFQQLDAARQQRRRAPVGLRARGIVGARRNRDVGSRRAQGERCRKSHRSRADHCRMRHRAEFHGSRSMSLYRGCLPRCPRARRAPGERHEVCLCLAASDACHKKRRSPKNNPCAYRIVDAVFVQAGISQKCAVDSNHFVASSPHTRGKAVYLVLCLFTLHRGVR